MTRRLTERQRRDLAVAEKLRSTYLPYFKAQGDKYNLDHLGWDDLLFTPAGTPTDFQRGFCSGLYALCTMFEVTGG